MERQMFDFLFFEITFIPWLNWWTMDATTIGIMSTPWWKFRLIHSVNLNKKIDLQFWISISFDCPIKFGQLYINLIFARWSSRLRRWWNGEKWGSSHFYIWWTLYCWKNFVLTSIGGNYYFNLPLMVKVQTQFLCKPCRHVLCWDRLNSLFDLMEAEI